jgi:hypothetical protein
MARFDLGWGGLPHLTANNGGWGSRQASSIERLTFDDPATRAAVTMFSGRRDIIEIVEGGSRNAESVHTLIDFRKNCDKLIALGQCAFTGGFWRHGTQPCRPESHSGYAWKWYMC